MLSRCTSIIAMFLVVLLSSSCSFEVKGPEGFQFKEDSTGNDTIAEVLDISTAEVMPEVAADTLPEVTEPPDATETNDAVEIQAGCTDHEECVSEVECVVGACEEGECSFTADDSLCQEFAGICVSATCDPEEGCATEPLTGEECDAGSNCVVEAQCDESGECKILEMVLCEKQCYSGECDEDSGECVYEIVDGGPCSDDTECTGEDTCSGGECIGTPIPGKCPCGGDDDCASFPVADLCTGESVCLDGMCTIKPGSQVECEPFPPGSCIEHVCLPETGECTEVPLPAGAACDDMNPCTAGDKCSSAGGCAGTAPVTPEGETLTCDIDGTACTLDYCMDGECKPGPQKSCPFTDECSEWVCEYASGECVQQPFSGTPCDDGIACTVDDKCVQGLCTQGMNICVDCTEEGLDGHPCSDDDDATAGDFCFGHNCVGLKTHTWEPEGCETSALDKISSSGNFFHAIGVKGCDDNNLTPRFFEVSLAGVTGGESTILGSTPLSDVDGNFAVGEPDKVYQHVNDWLLAAEFISSLEGECPCLGESCSPVTVSYREKDGAGVGGLTTERAAFMGMHVDDPLSDDCFMAMCVTTVGNQWQCAGMPFAHLETSIAEGMHVEASSVWMPVDWSSCNGTFQECLGETGKMYAAYRAWSPDDAGVPPLNAIVWGGKKDNSTDFFWTTIHVDGPADESPASSYRINDIREDDDGNFFAVGSEGFIFIQDASDAQQLAPPFLSLAPGVIHYQGIYRNNYATVIAANHLVVATDSEGQETYEVRAGLLAGSGDLLLGNLSVEQPFFNELSVFSICADCYEQEFGNWGLSDLAVRQDHPSGIIVPGANKAVLGVCGTTPDAISGSPRGQISILTP